MADTLCGPSNALQSFQKHSQVDRTLQQDRIIGPRFSPAQGFRSHDPRTGSLDADFHAFENATSHPFQFPDPFLSQPHHVSFTSQSRLQPQAAGWASDFSNMQISDHPIPAQQFRTEAPLLTTTNGGWQDEFMRQRQNNPVSVAQGKQAIVEQQQSLTLGNNGFMQYQTPMQTFQPLQSGTSQFEHGDQSQQQHLTNTSAADWSQAFEEAFEDAMQTERTLDVEQAQMLHQDGTYTNDHTQETDLSIQEPENLRIGSDAIDYTEMTDRTHEQESRDSSALARVAGELLHNVQHDSSEKFANSQFLDLMRKIRDRQVEVRNNDFEYTQSDAAHQVGMVTTNLEQDNSSSQTADRQDNFQFPDLNAVYEPSNDDVIDYSFDSDQYPNQDGVVRNQISDLHPGGRLYPGSLETGQTQMSGGLVSVPVEEFEKTDESRVFGTRYQKPTVEAENLGIA